MSDSATKPAKKKKRSRRFIPHIGDAIALQQRITAGTATPAETELYTRMISDFRRKYRNGLLSPQSARQFGFE